MKPRKKMFFFHDTNFKLKNNIPFHKKMEQSIQRELPTNVNSKRLLLTDRLLYIPKGFRITTVTNSFDVVHSWFLPGLGLKMDCVPGRSTHHSFRINTNGFFYGQCAEICGRFHHHMPIRLLSLNFHHFIIWWNYKILPLFWKSD